MTATAISAGLSRLGDGPALDVDGVVHSGTQVLRAVFSYRTRPADDAARTGESPSVERLFTRLGAWMAGSVEPNAEARFSDLRAAIGPEPRRTAVVTRDADAVLAAWSEGAFVLLGSPDVSAAKVLAFLERSGATEAVLPSELAGDLPSAPAVAVTDLSALRRIVCVGEFPGDLTALADLGPEPKVVAAKEPELLVTDLVAEATRAADEEIAGLDVERVVAAVDLVGRTALKSMLHALHRAGCFSGTDGWQTEREILDAAGVSDQHRPLVRRWLSVLVEQGLLSAVDGRLMVAVDPGQPNDLSHAWDETERSWRATHGGALTVEYARTSAERLPELLSGQCQAVTLLFPEGRLDIARAVYRESVTARYQHRAVAALVGGIAARWKRDRPLRVLEVGAGTGATTEVLLPALDRRKVDYLFTDVSKYFLDQARNHFGESAGVRYGIYDIDTDPRAQGFQLGGFDVVVGGGVLNAATDTDASVRWLADLLGPGGWLVLTEPTVEEFWVMASQAFLMSGALDGRAETGATFLSLPQWNAVLDGAGLRRELGLPVAGHPLERLGHRVFAARVRPSVQDGS